MSDIYVYQLQGIIEAPDKSIKGFRAMVCTAEFLEDVDIPASIFDPELLAYLKYRLAVSDYLNIQQLPDGIINRIRKPAGAWLDNWIIQRENGD